MSEPSGNYLFLFGIAVFCVVMAFAILLFVWLIWKKINGSRDSTLLIERLQDLERRVAEEISRSRETSERALREATESQGRVQLETAQKLTSQFEQTRTQLVDTLNDRFHQIQQQQSETLEGVKRSQEERLGKVEEAMGNLEKRQIESAAKQAESQARGLEGFKETFTNRMQESQKSQAELFTALQDRVRLGLDQMRQENEAKLEKIRLTVDEKLQATLENRLGESFKIVSERLEQVHKGLGEMQSLASGVGDLKRVLTNVRSRGVYGEVQLEALLEQVMTPAQYEKNCATIPNSNERVEFAIRLPGRGDDDSIVYLPIDAKFPQEDYLRLQDAYEAGDQAALEAAQRGLRTRLLNEASKIRQKYVAPPHTTDFALLFLPTEGLYAEVLRMGGVAEQLQSDHQVILVGPTTLYAVLNSLQMGFRTLAIEKRSGEVWKVLGAVKTEFGKFGESLKAVSKKLQEASNKIDDSARRSRVMERKLREVEALPDADTNKILPFAMGEEEDENGEPDED